MNRYHLKTVSATNWVYDHIGQKHVLNSLLHTPADWFVMEVTLQKQFPTQTTIPILLNTK